MKQKINLRLIAISVLAVLATVLSITFVYYDLFQEQVKKDLRMEARIISVTGLSKLKENETIAGDRELRITWISSNGDVLFDNDATNLGNHLDRPEVQDAFEYGIGESVRKSDTMNMRTFYYAVLLDDGTVLRVATEARSIFSVFVSTFPIVLLIIVIIIELCIVISHMLTRQLLEPISVMADDLDNVNGVAPYKELAPFVTRIREQHKDILAAAKSRQDFTANVSHELKTPITAISGYAELIENRMVDEEQQIKFAGEIRKHADRLVSLVNDIIRLSELDHKESIPDFSKLDLYEIVEDRIELLKNNARGKNIKITLQGEKCFVTSNKSLLVELIDNLVENAIRYNVQNGSVEIIVREVENQAELVVTDTGIGIPKEEQSRVFERFYRVDKSRSRETGGTGLGLAIVKHIVELHDGEIELNSEIGKGTTIRIRL
ncbi:MAG: sensor histidine kinase [Wujia sp.]